MPKTDNKEDLPILAHFQKIPRSLKNRISKNEKQEESFANFLQKTGGH